jgi:D-beta-D-heptose 7-phosphate kinase/D-beta-D-heptose 1-phosphate adenosyltransferase
MTPRILVVGDAMVDRYVHHRTIKVVHGVPVVAVQRIVDQSGGAAAVAEMCAALDAEVALACGPRKSLKVRHVVGHHASFRRDEDAYITAAEARTLLQAHLQEAYDLILVSDYGKGMVTEEVVSLCVETGIRVLADPYPGVSPETYRGCYCVCPSWSAYTAFAEEWSRRERLCVKMDDRGVFVKDGEATALIPAHDVDSVDSCGAGDQFMAALAVMLTTSQDLVWSASVANLAAGLKCAKCGTTPVTTREIAEAARAWMGTRSPVETSQPCTVNMEQGRRG